MSMKSSKHHQVICFGEVLWDLLPSGAVPGGAPMNVAYHLHKLDKEPALITRVGKDEKGEELKKIFSERGVCTDYFQDDDRHETGKVYAREGANHEMSYEIVMDAAWDFIGWRDEHEGLVKDAPYFVFGSLAARSETSRNTLMKLLESARTKVFDINLRAPHYSQDLIETLLHKADILKLNESELELLTRWFIGEVPVDESIKRIAEKFSLSTVVVTLGAEGALLFMEGKMYRHQGYKVVVKDTVGSGDAFLASLLSQLMKGAQPAAALDFANGLGALIASKTGACPEYALSEVEKVTGHAFL